MPNSDEHQIRIDAEMDVDPRVDLAVERTELALERTQLAWVRTLLSMIGGGFVFDKGLEGIHRARVASGDALLRNVHAVGMLITGCGTLLMVFVTILYVKRTMRLAYMRNGKKLFLAPDIILSALTILIGCVLFYLIGFSPEA